MSELEALEREAAEMQGLTLEEWQKRFNDFWQSDK